MLTFLKKYKKLLIILSFPYVYLMFLLVMPTQKQILAPGDLTPVGDAIIIDGIEMASQFHTIYVYNYYPMTPFQGLIASVNETLEVSALSVRDKDISWRDNFLSGQVSKLSSLQISLIQAYTLAKNIDETIDIDYYFEGLLLSYRPSRLKDLEIGDVIISINGESYLDHDETSFKNLSRVSEATLEIKRTKNGVESFHTVSYQLEENESYLYYYPNYVITDSKPSFQLPGLEGVIGGPSGGMIQTLSIYASLLKLNIGHIKIAGTGTIEMDGSVGPIGGIRQKIYTAINQDVDLFIMPKAHENEINDMKIPFDLLVVSTIEEAVQLLYEGVN